MESTKQDWLLQPCLSERGSCPSAHFLWACLLVTNMGSLFKASVVFCQVSVVSPRASLECGDARNQTPTQHPGKWRCQAHATGSRRSRRLLLRCALEGQAPLALRLCLLKALGTAHLHLQEGLLKPVQSGSVHSQPGFQAGRWGSLCSGRGAICSPTRVHPPER